MTRVFSSAVLISLIVELTGCGGGATAAAGGDKAVLSSADRSGFKTASGDMVHKEAAKSLLVALSKPAAIPTGLGRSSPSSGSR